MFIKRLFRVLLSGVVLALLLAVVPVVVSAEMQASGVATTNNPAQINTIGQAPIAAPASDAQSNASTASMADTTMSAPGSAVASNSQSNVANVANASPAVVPEAVVASDHATGDIEAVPARSGKWIEVILEEQRLVAWEDGRMVMTTPVSTGTRRTPTVRGTFRVYRKYERVRMAGRDYDLPNVPYVMYFRGSYAMHGTYWHNNFGQPMSHGCINMPTGKAAWLYQWAPRGTAVVIH